MFAWPATNLRLAYTFECACGETASGGQQVAMSLNADVLAPTLPDGWAVINGTAWCAKHTFTRDDSVQVVPDTEPDIVEPVEEPAPPLPANETESVTPFRPGLKAE